MNRESDQSAPTPGEYDVASETWVPHPGCPDWSDEANLPILYARDRLHQAIYSLPYVSQVTGYRSGNRRLQSEVQFLDDMTEWLTKFSQALATVENIVGDMSEELERFRAQRDAVRNFLGTGTRPVTTYSREYRDEQLAKGPW